MIVVRRFIAALFFCCSLAQAQTTAPTGTDQRRTLTLDAGVLPLGGALKTPQYWQSYKARFITSAGRVIDTANDLISHSEGQGYAMLLAVAANDRPTFDRLWGWTRANLMVRDDQLIAWRWSPNHRPGVSDMNNASDGDILVAWALAEAGELWADVSYKVAARRIAVEVGRKLVLFKTKQGALLLPAIAGFAAGERPDGPVVNLSYYVFPAFARLPLVAPELRLERADADRSRSHQVGTLRTAKPADGMDLHSRYQYPPGRRISKSIFIQFDSYTALHGVGRRG